MSLRSSLITSALVYAAWTSPTAVAATSHSEFIYYPAFRGGTSAQPKGVVEMANDKGLTVELVVRCNGRPGVVTYSKLEHIYCSAKHRCSKALGAAIRDTCR